MQPEAVATEKSSEGNGASTIKDPVLLGVSLPVSATVAAATQLKDAWADAFQALLSAAKSKANAAKSKASSSSSGPEIKA
jgi:hypothetical protein